MLTVQLIEIFDKGGKEAVAALLDGKIVLGYRREE